MFATGPRRRKGLEFVCLFGHDGHRQHARLDARRVQEVVTLPRAFWRFVVRTSVDLECFYPTPELGVSDWTGRLAHGGQRHAQPPGPARLDDRRRDNIEVQLGEVKGVERCPSCPKIQTDSRLARRGVSDERCLGLVGNGS